MMTAKNTIKTISVTLLGLMFAALLGGCSKPAGPAPQEDGQGERTAAESGTTPVADATATPAADAAGDSAGDSISLPPLAIETVGITETLPERYPPNWFLVHDVAFFGMSDGRVSVIDATATTISEQVKGTFNISFIGLVTEGLKRSEIYVTETFHSRGTRGERTDVITIWDKKNLAPVGEIVLPEPKRFLGLPERNTLQLIDDERFLLSFNLNPATSVTVIDLDAREIVAEISIPGCVKMFPTGRRGFSSLCGDGRFLTTELNEDGSLAQQSRGEVFFNSDTSPIFQRNSTISGVSYFPTFDGNMIPVDMSGPTAVPGTAWPLVPQAEQAVGWRPGGLGLIDSDDQGRIYVLMHPEGGEGSHQSGGAQVWVFDPLTQQRVQKIALQEWGLSIAVSRGETPLMMVTNPISMTLEVYQASSGDYVQSLDDLYQVTPLMLYGAR